MRRLFLFFVVVASLMTVSGLIYAADFSADMTSIAGGQRFSGKIAVSGDKMRMEMPGATTITRMDRQIAWLIMPAQGMYMETKFDPRNVAAVEEKVPGEVERQYIGDEMVNGRIAKKYKVVYDAGGDREAIMQWMVEGVPVPVRVSSMDGSWVMEYTNINMTAQDPALFEVPDGYQKLSMPVMPGE